MELQLVTKIIDNFDNIINNFNNSKAREIVLKMCFFISNLSINVR